MSVFAQAGNPPPAAIASHPAGLSADQLEKLVGKIALYPDDLLAIVLPAATQPIQIVEAQRFLERRKSDPTAQPPKSWDPSVIALLNYPEVVATLNSDLTWTEQLGNAVIDQQAPVMDAIQSFRQKVYVAGNLKSNDKQKVEVQAATAPPPEAPQTGPVSAEQPAQQTIVIESASPDVIYVPSYNPATVVVPPEPGIPYPYAYSAPYPYYWAPGAAFFTGAFFGATLGYALSWANGGIYHGDVNINNNFNRINNGNLGGNRENRWRPDRGQGDRGRPGARPTPQSIKSGLAERGGQRPGAGAGRREGAGAGAAQRPGGGGGRAAQRPATGGGRAAQRPAAGGGRAGGPGGQRPSAGAGRPGAGVAQRPAAGGGRGQAAAGFGGAGFGGYRGSGAFAGAGNSFTSNQASFRGNQSLGRSQFTGNRSFGGGGRSFGGGGGRSFGGGGGRGFGGGGRAGGGGRRR